jgi:hypothetical protein
VGAVLVFILSPRDWAVKASQLTQGIKKSLYNEACIKERIEKKEPEGRLFKYLEAGAL